jgi:hypothetical protein
VRVEREGRKGMGASQSAHDLATAVVRLEREPISAADAFWDELIGATFTVEELYKALPPATVRGLLRSPSMNLRILVERAVGNCRNYALAFDDAHNLLPPAEQLFATPDLPVVLNSLHILGRLLPFLLEPHGEVSDEEALAALFWTGESHPTRASLTAGLPRASPRVH